MKRDYRFEVTLTEVEKKKLKLLAAYCQENGSPGLDSWKSPAAHTRGIIYWLWREVYAPDKLTPEEAQEWHNKVLAEEAEGRFSGSGYSARRDRRRSKNATG